MASPGDVWYFAYGSNLDPDQKTKRTGTIREQHRARLDGYRFAFNKLAFKKPSGKEVAYANVVPDPQSCVWGVVYRCNPEAMAALDGYEAIGSGHRGHYVRETVTVQLDSGERVEADIYIAHPSWVRDGLQPPDDYLEKILRGAQHHGLPEDCIRFIESAAGRHHEK